MAAGGFTVDAARALGGPDWLVARRVAAAERFATLPLPTPQEEIWRYSRIDELDLDRFRPMSAEELGAPGDERAPGGGPWAAADATPTPISRPAAAIAARARISGTPGARRPAARSRCG